MSSAERKDTKDDTAVVPRFENMFDNFRRDMEKMMTRPWSFPTWDLPSPFEARDMRMALYDLIDRGDKYELSLEVPGIDKEKIDVKASRYSRGVRQTFGKDRGKGQALPLRRAAVPVVLSKRSSARGNSAVQGVCQGGKRDIENGPAQKEPNTRRRGNEGRRQVESILPLNSSITKGRLFS